MWCTLPSETAISNYRRSLRANPRPSRVAKKGRAAPPLSQKASLSRGARGKSDQMVEALSATTPSALATSQRGRGEGGRPITQLCLQPAGAIFFVDQSLSRMGLLWGSWGCRRVLLDQPLLPQRHPFPQSPPSKISSGLLYYPVAHAHIPIEPLRKAARHHSAAATFAAEGYDSLMCRNGHQQKTFTCSRRAEEADEDHE